MTKYVSHFFKQLSMATITVVISYYRYSIKTGLDSGLWTPDFSSRFLNEKKRENSIVFKKENKTKIKNFKTFKK